MKYKKYCALTITMILACCFGFSQSETTAQQIVTLQITDVSTMGIGEPLSNPGSTIYGNSVYSIPMKFVSILHIASPGKEKKIIVSYDVSESPGDKFPEITIVNPTPDFPTRENMLFSSTSSSLELFNGIIPDQVQDLMLTYGEMEKDQNRSYTNKKITYTMIDS